MSPGVLVAIVVVATFTGAALGGIVTAVLFAVVASIAAAVLQIRALGRPKR